MNSNFIKLCTTLNKLEATRKKKQAIHVWLKKTSVVNALPSQQQQVTNTKLWWYYPTAYKHNSMCFS